MAPIIDLREQLPRVFALQECDEEIARLTEQRRNLVRHLKQLDERLQKQQQAFETKRHAFQEIQVEQRKKNTEILSGKERLAKYQEQLKVSANAHEYQALTSQIALSTEILDGLEEEAIAILLQLDESQKELAEEEARWTTAQEEHKRDKHRAIAAVKKLDAKSEEARATREICLPTVQASLAQDYMHWRERRKITWVAKMVGGTCAGCNMNLPPQMAVEARQLEKAYFCPSCKRLLYPESDVLNIPIDEPPVEVKDVKKRGSRQTKKRES